jgi:hypothetical protein
MSCLAGLNATDDGRVPLMVGKRDQGLLVGRWLALIGCSHRCIPSTCIAPLGKNSHNGRMSSSSSLLLRGLLEFRIQCWSLLLYVVLLLCFCPL